MATTKSKLQMEYNKEITSAAPSPEYVKMYFGQRFHTPIKLQKNAFNS
jgi:hypothetical protein